MKRIKLILTFSLLLPYAISAQTVGIWRAGSANILKGKVYTLSCFISDSDGSWTYEEKLQVLKQLREAEVWLTKQAAAYNVDLSFEGGNFGLQQDIKVKKVVRGTASGNESSDIIWQTLKQIGYKTPLGYYDWVKKNTSNKNTHVILFAKGEGNGYALPFGDGMDKQKYFVEGSILYEKYWGGMKLSSSSIAHELLHLYGAWDLYTTHSQPQDREKMANKIYPNSIMHRTSYNFSELEVDELSAWLIGWNKSPKNSFEWFRPSDAPVKLD